MALFCEYNTLHTESDVEQKFIYPFLTAKTPMGLGLDSSQILTKPLLRQVLIGKGQKQKYYYPDYLVAIRGIPVLVLEAKKPTELLDAAYSEARLYAEEINAHFQHRINTCQIVIACNGKETWAGYSDQAIPKIKLSYEDFNVGNTLFTDLLKMCSKEVLDSLVDKPYAEARGSARFNTPVSVLGGKRVQNGELEENSFGRTLIFENRRIFDPETEEDRRIIVENAYITSAKREQHIEPIYREIRKFECPGEEKLTPLATDEPVELVQKFYQRIEEKNEVYSLLLLVGNVGSGKTTFVRYFQRAFLEKNHPEISKRCDWVFVNMNQSPISRDEIYGWMKEKIKEQLINNHRDIDFSNIGIIRKIFHKEVYNFDSGVGSLLKADENEYNRQLFFILKDLIEDPTKYLNALVSYLKDQHRLLPIIVLDNCDKRNKEEQLLMFEVAQWVRTTFSCMVILPMRDSTYDQYKDEPPLDTVVRDLVFRIDPPDLLKVIQARLDYINRITEQASKTYVLQNGMNVAIKKEELVEYFKCIMLAIRGNRMASDIFYRISDRNTRKGIQVFEDFCKSGHISSNDIFLIRTNGKDYQFPAYKFLNALLRKNRKYYNGQYSNFVNLFASDLGDDFPDPFIRIDILKWLKDRLHEEGPSKAKGMFKVGDIMRDMQSMGHNIKVARRELVYLLKHELVISESLSSDVSNDDLVKISIPGSLHVLMLNNVTYLAACAEDVYFKNSEIMTSISRRLASRNHLTRFSQAMTTSDLLRYLTDYREEYKACSSAYLKDSEKLEIYDLQECRNALEKMLVSDSNMQANFIGLQKNTVGSHVQAIIYQKTNNALLCHLADGPTCKGYISVNDPKFELSYDEFRKLQEDQTIECEIIEYSWDYNNYRLRYIREVC